MSEPLTKVDSAVQGLESPVKEKAAHRRASSAAAAGVLTVDELRDKKVPLVLAPETQRTGWKINTSPMTIEEKEILKKPLITPPVKRIDLHFPYGVVVTARNLKGLTIKDALDAIYKQNRKKDDDEIERPYFEGFEWNGEHPSLSEDDRMKEWTILHVRLTSTPTVSNTGGGKKKKNKGGDA